VALLLLAAAPAGAAQRFPNVVILTIDTLRADRVSAYGYRRPTTPHLDRLLAQGVRFEEARTVEPLTNPAVCSLFTSLYPHEHGATRNGLRLRPDALPLARLLGRRGYRTAAFVGNWTLRDALSGLGAHFQEYREVLTRKRWLGLFKGEATAEDLTDAALAWLAHRPQRPFLLWVHYVEPHAPYRLQEPFAARLSIDTSGPVSKSDRYDTEVAFADHHAGRLLAALAADPALAADTLVVFAADHGESLGEHGDWGHGRTLWEPALRIPLGIVWPGHIRPGVVRAAASNLDVAPTVLGLAGLPVPATFRGFDWSPVLRGQAEPPRERVFQFQAHKGAVLSMQEAASARRKGLLEVGVLYWPEGRKEVVRVADGRRSLFDLAADPGEQRSLSRAAAAPSPGIRDWLAGLRRGLAMSDRLAAAAAVDPESARKLRALGYSE
jgi:arylsulfatase A-like enzyme